MTYFVVDSQIYLHGNNLSKLHQHIDKALLPADLGGEGPTYHAARWAEELLGTTLDIQEDQECAFIR
jgi:hypothetical protein